MTDATPGEDEVQTSLQTHDLFTAVLSLHSEARRRAGQEELRRELRLQQSDLRDARDESADDEASVDAVGASILAAAGAVVAAAEASRMQEYVDAACIAAAIAFARVPTHAPRSEECERDAWIANERVVTFATEHNRLARRSVLAATLAAEALADELTASELTTSMAFDDSIIAILDARTVVRESDAVNRSARDHQYAASAALCEVDDESEIAPVSPLFAVEVNAAQVQIVATDLAAARAWALEPFDVERIFECERTAHHARERAAELAAEFGIQARPSSPAPRSGPGS